MKRRMTGSMLIVMALLEWTQEQYCGFQYESGVIYLRHYLNGSEPDIEIMERSDLFWGWWKLEWYKREGELLDSLFASKHFGKMKPYHFRESYRIINDAKGLADINSPYGKILCQSLCDVLIPQLNRLYKPIGG